MARFFITASNIFGGVAYLDHEEAEHIKVLRIKNGETFTLCDGAGTDYTCRIGENTENGLSVEILDKAPSVSEPSVYCAVYASYPKGDKAEMAKFKKRIAESKYGPGESYGIPYRSLVAKGLENLLVAGRCIGTDQYMQASVRVIPGCYITGQAAGLAAALSVRNGGEVRAVDTPALQSAIRSFGGSLGRMATGLLFFGIITAYAISILFGRIARLGGLPELCRRPAQRLRR